MQGDRSMFQYDRQIVVWLKSKNRLKNICPLPNSYHWKFQQIFEWYIYAEHEHVYVTVTRYILHIRTLLVAIATWSLPASNMDITR